MRLFKILLKTVSDEGDECYVSTSGLVVKREYDLTPNGNKMDGRWVLRDVDGVLIDFDRYRMDLEGRNKIKLNGGRD